MLCCLFVAALLAPFGVFARLPGGQAPACCAKKRMLLLAAGFGVFATGACLLLLIVPQAAPFHHICRFITVPRS
jgi:hypothetical protein